jgi:hypothetical protein
VQRRIYTNATYRPSIDGSCGRLPDLFERAESGDAVVRADCGIAAICSAIGPKKGFAMTSNVDARRFRRVALAVLISLALVFVMTASGEVPASARRVRVKRSVSTEFVGPPADQPLTAFKCYWVDPAAQYFCQATRTDKQNSPPIGFALEAPNPGDIGLFAGENPPDDIDANDFVRPRTFSCNLTGSDDTDPAAYSCAYRYGNGKTFDFTLDKAMAIKVQDDNSKEVFIDTWFMPRYK